MSETSEEEFFELRRRARKVDTFLQRHRVFDPTMGGGDLYLAEQKSVLTAHPEPFIKYATASEIAATLDEIEKAIHMGAFGDQVPTVSKLAEYRRESRQRRRAS